MGLAGMASQVGAPPRSHLTVGISVSPPAKRPELGGLRWAFRVPSGFWWCGASLAPAVVSWRMLKFKMRGQDKTGPCSVSEGFFPQKWSVPPGPVPPHAGRRCAASSWEPVCVSWYCLSVCTAAPGHRGGTCLEKGKSSAPRTMCICKTQAHSWQILLVCCLSLVYQSFVCTCQSSLRDLAFPHEN